MVRKLSRRHGHRPFGRAPTYRPALEELESRVVPSIRPPIQTYIVNVADGVPAQHDPLSLADAISKVNADPVDPSAPEIIKFDIRGPTPGPYTITAPAFGGFPVINHPVSILGSSQAGYTPTTPMIVLDGSGFNRDTAFVLDIAAGGSFVDGLVIREPNKNKFGFGGIFLHGGGGNEIDANFIGTDKSGTTAIAIDSQHQFLAAYGILIKGSNNNIIGGPNSGQTNLISGNETFGIGIEGSTGTIIENNYIGTKINGMDALANGIGILVHDSSGTIINGNLISGNRVAGIGFLGSSFGNLVRKNTIGTKVDGSGSVANDIGVLISGTANLGGILSSDKPTRNTIGGQLTDDFNLISGNNVGIQIEEGANQNKVSGNLIGTDFTGVLANGTGNSAGILIEGSPKNTIGGEVGVMTTKAAGEANVIAGNSVDGVRITGSDAQENLVEGNFIGLDAFDRGLLGSTAVGIGIADASLNIIGGARPTQANIIAGCTNGILIKGNGPSGNQVLGNRIGTDFQDSQRLGNILGVVIDGSSRNVIGTFRFGGGNVISGNRSDGVLIQGHNATPPDPAMNDTKVNTLQGNLIGTTNDGKRRLHNVGSGIRIADASLNTIGGTGDTGNVISGNDGNGVQISGLAARENTIAGNRIGTNVDGDTDVPNSGDGVLIDGAPFNKIGGQTGPAFNVISGNANYGVHIKGDSAGANVLRGNFIGIGAGVTPRAVPNQLDGVLIDDAPNNVIGESGLTIISNVIAGNLRNGIRIRGQHASRNLVQNNQIGTNNNVANLSNGHAGLVIQNASNNTIGAEAAHGQNVISGNAGNGLIIIGPGAEGNLIQNDLIGTTGDGKNALANSLDGILVQNANKNTIGGSGDLGRNIISGNGGNGVEIRDLSTQNIVQDSYIGTDINGVTAIPNATFTGDGDGILIDAASSNTIGGSATDVANVISGNALNNIHIRGNATANLVLNSYVGTNSAGTQRIGYTNAQSKTRNGILIEEAPRNMIGTTTNVDPTVALNLISGMALAGIGVVGSSAEQNQIDNNWIGLGNDGSTMITNDFGVVINHAHHTLIGVTAGNVVSASVHNGISIQNGSQDNKIQANFIGTDSTGTASRPNGGGVVLYDSSDNNTLVDNVISGNNGAGVVIDSFGNKLGRNKIGTDRFGSGSCPNLRGGIGPGHGVLIRNGATGNTIGAGNAGNIIRFNEGVGVFMGSGTSANDLSGNSISDNVDARQIVSPTGNTFGMTAVFPGSSHIEGMVQALPRTTYTIEFFACTAPNSAGLGQGEEFLGSEQVTTDAAGLADVRADFPTLVPVGQFITTTITGPNEDTSGFSPAFPVTPPPSAPDELSIDNVTLAEGDNGITAFVFTVTRRNFSDHVVTVQVDTADGTAMAADGDYAAVHGLILTFSPGGLLQQKVTINVPGNLTVEPDEWFSVNLSNVTGGTIGKGIGQGTILNDDRTAFSVGDVALPEGESGTTAFAFTVGLSNPSEQPVTVQVDTADGTATTAEGDYTPITGQVLTFNPGDPLTQTVIVSVAADTTVEPADTFTLNLSNPTGRNLSIARSVGTGTILNDNRAAFSVSDVTLPEGNSGSTAFAFTVSLSSPSEQPVTVQVDTADGTATAAEGDYAPLTGRVLTFKPGDPLTQTFMVNVAGNISVEPDETFTLSLSQPTGLNVSIAKTTGVGAILNDDATSVSINDAAIVEGDSGVTPLVFTVSLSNPSEQPVSVHVDTVDDTARVEANDYLPISALLLTFSPGGPLTQTVSVDVVGNLRPEPDRRFTVRLSHATGADEVLAKTVGAGTIVDDDLDSDGDGIPDKVENGARNGGDGNHDGIPDRQQSNVTSLPNAVDGQYVTLAAPAGTVFESVFARANPDPLHAPPGISFPLGFFDYILAGLPPSGAATITMFLPPGLSVSQFYKYGRRTPADVSPSFYQFPFDGSAGAEIVPDRIIVHVVDGGAGDNDLTANGLLVDSAGPAQVTGTDVALEMSRTPDPVGEGQPLTYSLTVSNLGPSDATGVTLNDTLPAGATLVNSHSSQGTFELMNGVVTFRAGSVAIGATVNATLVVKAPRVPGIITNSATGSYNEGDLDPSNNTATQATSVQTVGIISGQKFEDLNGNGQHDAGEPGLDGVTVELLGASTGAVMQTMTTGSVDLNGDGVIDPETERGRYSFAVLEAATFVVREMTAPGFAQTLPSGGSVTQRISVDNTGVEGNRASSRPTISADGRFVAFLSSATNLVPGDTNGQPDVFVYDRVIGQIERVSVPDPSTGQREANGRNLFPAISPDGRFVAFQSLASNLVPGDTNLSRDIFVHDRVTGATQLVSSATDGTEGDKTSGPIEGGRGPVFSADSRYVAFESDATNLVPADNNNATDVFVKDRQTGVTERVSVNGAGQGTGLNFQSFTPSISADGRYVAFVSRGDNLLPNDTNRSADIFVKDRVTGAIERVNTDNAGGQADLQSNSGNPSISNDGRFVAFESTAANLMLGDSNGLADIFVKDRQTGEIERVSVDGNGNQAASGTRIVGSFNPSISADGRFVAFQSDAANLVPGDTNQMSDVFVHDRQTGQTVRVSADSSGNQATGTAFVTLSSDAAISADGQTVAFDSTAANLVPADGNNLQDVFVRTTGAGGDYTATTVLGQTQTGFDFGNAPTMSDPTIIKRGPGGPLVAGTEVTYTLNYRNLGVAAAQNVQVIDDLPSGLAFARASSGGVFDAAAGTVTFTIGILQANDGAPGGPDEGSATVTARVIASSGIVTNSAAISTSSQQSTPSNDRDTSANAVIAADVTIIKAGPVAPLLSGTNATYTLTYRNLGGAAAQNVSVVDTLPAGLTFVSASGAGRFDPASNALTFAVGTLAASNGAPGGTDEGSVTVTALVAATGGSVMNTATVSTTTGESDTTNNQAATTNTVIATDVTVAKTGPAGSVVSGTYVTYTIAYRNLGTAAAQNVALVDAVPAGLRFISASPGAIFNQASNAATFAIGTLAADDGAPGGPDEGNVNVLALVTASGGTVTSSATISTSTPESNTANDTSSVSENVTAADATLAESGPTGDALVGTQITYTLNYRNLGTVAAQDVQVLDSLPAGLSFVNAGAGGSFDLATRHVTFNVGTLAANDGAPGGPDEGSATVTALVTANGGTVTNTASITTTTGESDTTNNNGTFSTAVTAADLTVSKRGPAGPLLFGTDVTYTLGYRNLGTAAAPNVTLIDTLPAGLSFRSAGGGSFDSVTNSVTFALGTLPAGGLDEANVAVTAHVTATGGTVRNVAIISTTTPESDITNNRSIFTNAVTFADVALNQTGPAGPLVSGTNVTYALDYRNYATAPAQDVTVIDTLPLGIKFVSASPGGRFDPATDTVTFRIGMLGAGDGAAGGSDEGAATVTALVTAIDGTVTNTAAISTTAPEPDTLNNTSFLQSKVIAADVTVDNAAPIGPLLAGTEVVYAVPYRNLGSAPAQNTTLTINLPAGLTFLAADSDSTFNPLTGQVTFAIGTVPANDGSPAGANVGAVQIAAEVTATAGLVTNVAVIATSTAESDITNNQNSFSNSITSADVTISQTGPPSPVLSGGQVTFTLHYRNLGTAAAANVVLNDILPSGLSFVSASGEAGFDPATNTVDFLVGMLAADDGAAAGPDEGTVTVCAEVTAIGASLTNTATISTTTVESNAANNTAWAMITVDTPPVAVNETFTLKQNTPLNVAAPGVLANDFDANGDSLTAVAVSRPAHGELTLKSNGSFIYTPATNFYGTDTFAYKAKDGAFYSNVATVTLTVHAGAVSGTTLADLTGNGFSPDDTPMGGVSINLYVDTNANGVLDIATDKLLVSITTANDGAYSFSNLSPATYFVQEVAPPNMVRTGPATQTYYTIPLAPGQDSTSNNFDNAESCDTGLVQNVSFVINGTYAVNDLRGKTHQGDEIQVTFTYTGTALHPFTLVSYRAPGPTFDATTASQQTIFQAATGTFGPGTYKLTATIPDCYYQIDFVCGAAIDRLGPAGSNIFYTPQNRLLSADNGGRQACVTNASVVSGHAYNDVTGNGPSADDTPQGAVTINLYRDSNGNGKLDVGTDTLLASKGTVPGSGDYSFSNLPASATYFVQEVVPGNSVQTGPISGYYKVVITGANTSIANQDFDNFLKYDNSIISNIRYYITTGNTTRQVSSLSGHTRQGDKVQVTFNVAQGHTAMLSLISYNAPGSSFDAGKAYLQTVFQSDTGTFAGGSDNLTVVIPKNYFQIDFVCGPVLVPFGPAGSNIFYTPQGRLLGSDGGGLNPRALTADGSAVLNSAGDPEGVVTSFADLRGGEILVAVDTLSAQAAAEQARIDAAIAALDADLGSFGVNLVEVSGDNAALADIHIQVASTSSIGGVAQGVLGVTTGSDITLIDGWNWYLGDDPGAVGANQYDFQTVVTHELGHALGMAHSPDATSVMYWTLAPAEARRPPSGSDLAFIQNLQETGPEPLIASPYAQGQSHAPGCACPLCTGAATNMITLSPSALFNLVEQNLKQRQTASTASSHPSGCGCPLCTGAAQSGNNLGLRLPSAVRQVVGRGSVLQGIEADATFGAGLLASPAFAIPTLTGSAGSHVLVGGVGNEVLVGGRGSDLLLGGFDSAKQTDSRMLVDADVAAASAHDASVAAGRGGDATYDAIFADWGNDFRAPELWT